MSGDAIFESTPAGVRGLGWMFKCAAMAGIVAIGWRVGQLGYTCLALIAGYTALRAVIPYFSNMRAMATDRTKCAAERMGLIGTPTSDIADIHAIDDTQAGSVFKLVKLVCRSSDRASRLEVIESFFAAFDAYWDERLGPLQDAADEAPVLGLSGSLLGIVAALGALSTGVSDNQALFDGMSTMALTTLAGGAAYILISGLSRDAANQVQKHRSDLMFVALMFVRDDSDLHSGSVAAEPDEPNPFDLFSREVSK